MSTEDRHSPSQGGKGLGIWVRLEERGEQSTIPSPICHDVDDKGDVNGGARGHMWENQDNQNVLIRRLKLEYAIGAEIKDTLHPNAKVK